MASPQYSILYSAKTGGVSGNGSAGDVLIEDSTTGLYVIATTANRTGRKATGVALYDYQIGQSVEIQEIGKLVIDVGLAAPGTQQYVRCSTTGRLEVVASPSAGDNILGTIDKDGRIFLDSAIPLGGWSGGGGGGFTPPTGTGPVKVSGGALVGAATAINLADATNDVTGTLGHANGGTDVTSPGANGNVLTSNGTNWTSAAPTGEANTGANVGTGTGNVFRDKTGVTINFKTLKQGANVTITDNANDVTIAASGGGSFTPPTGTGFVTVTGGSLDAASLAYPLGVAKGGSGATTFSTGILHASGTAAFTSSLIVDADVSASAAIAASKLAPPGTSTQVIYNGSGAFAANANFTHDGGGNVTAGNSVSVGSTVAGSALFRVPWQPSVPIMAQRNVGNTGDWNIIQANTSTIKFGDDSRQLTCNIYGTNVQIISGVGAIDLLPNAGNYGFSSDGTSGWNASALPVIGDTRANSPYGVHAMTQISVSGSFTMAAADYKCSAIEFTGTPGAGFTVTMPAPASLAKAYWKWMWNSTNALATISTGTGTTRTLASNKGDWFLFSSLGVNVMQASPNTISSSGSP